MATEFTVRGRFTAFQAPERGTARVTLAYEGPAPQPVYDRLARDLDTVKAALGDLHDPERGPVTWWATQQVRTWAQRPWNQDGKRLPLVHHAAVGLQAKFRDFGRLTAWVGALVGSVEGFRLDGVDWALTEQRRAELERDVRTRAVRDAARRAQHYADALGLGPVRPVAIADAGMLGAPPVAGGGAAYARMAAHESGAAELALVPEDIEVSAEVDARFVAD